MGDELRVKLPIPRCPFPITGSLVFDFICVHLRSSAVNICFSELSAKRGMRSGLNILLSAAIAYAVIMVLVFLFQSRLVYFPEVARARVATPRAAGLDYEDVQLRTADAETLHGWWVPARNARGAVLILHGNAGNISHRLDYLTMFNRLGYATLIIDYRGYGRSNGTPAGGGPPPDGEAG